VDTNRARMQRAHHNNQRKGYTHGNKEKHTEEGRHAEAQRAGVKAVVVKDKDYKPAGVKIACRTLGDLHAIVMYGSRKGANYAKDTEAEEEPAQSHAQA